MAAPKPVTLEDIKTALAQPVPPEVWLVSRDGEPGCEVFAHRLKAEQHAESLGVPAQVQRAEVTP